MHEILHLWVLILGGKVRGKVATIDRAAADFGKLGRVPAVPAQERDFNTEGARLFGDQSSLRVITGNKNRLRLRGFDGSELGAEISVRAAAAEGAFAHDL